MTLPLDRPTVPPSTRDRLLLAFANLNSYGIAAQPALGGAPAATRTALQRGIHLSFPNGRGSCIFWSRADESCFDADGTLQRPLTLHHSGAEVGRAARAALREVGLSCSDGPGEQCLTITSGDAPASNRRASPAAVRSV